MIRGFDDLTSKEYGSSFLATIIGSEGLLASLNITSRLQNDGSIGNQDVITVPQRDIHILLVLLSVVSRVAREGEMDSNHSTLRREDVARAMEVYQARRACLVSYPLLALIAYTVALPPRCGAADDDDKQQGFNTLAYTGRIVSCHRLS